MLALDIFPNEYFPLGGACTYHLAIGPRTFREDDSNLDRSPGSCVDVTRTGRNDAQ
jgi:hypothetical protein